MKLQYLLKSKSCACVSEVTCNKPVAAKEILRSVNKTLQPGQAPFKSAKLVKEGQHICRYCEANIVDNPNDDVLCKDCREDFGHSLYSEL